MKRFWIGVLALVLLTALCGQAFAQSAQPLPIPNGEVAQDVPGAKELPDPKMVYKVVFDIATAAPKIDEVNPGLSGVVRYLNTLAKNGVPADHRKIAVVLHQNATEIILNDDTFKARNDGHDNPNIALIQSMKKAGVDFRVCGQSVLAHKIDPKTIVPEIELDLWALTTLVNLQLRRLCPRGWRLDGVPPTYLPSRLRLKSTAERIAMVGPAVENLNTKMFRRNFAAAEIRLAAIASTKPPLESHEGDGCLRRSLRG
jgi:intracellular sulfur oxidation DsrE/DsrF family protein